MSLKLEERFKILEMWRPNWTSRQENYNIWSENSLDEMHSKLDIVDEKISEPKDRAIKIIQMKYREKKFEM